MRPNVDMTVPASALAGRGAPISPIVLIKGAGEMASAVAWRLYMANIRRICMTELDAPLCVRRTVSFCTAIEDGGTQVEGVEACVARNSCRSRISLVQGENSGGRPQPMGQHR